MGAPLTVQTRPLGQEGHGSRWGSRPCRGFGGQGGSGWQEAPLALTHAAWGASPAAGVGTDLRMARETFCFQGLSFRMPMPKPERKKSSPVVTRSHFCEASNSSTAESQMKAWSLLGTGRGQGGKDGQLSLQLSLLPAPG